MALIINADWNAFQNIKEALHNITSAGNYNSKSLSYVQNKTHVLSYKINFVLFSKSEQILTVLGSLNIC